MTSVVKSIGDALNVPAAWWTGFGAAIMALSKSLWPYRKSAIDREQNEVARLVAEVGELRRRLDDHQKQSNNERQRLEDKIEGQRALYETKMDTERVRYEIDITKMRHRANGADQCLDAFVMLLEMEDGLSPKIKRALAAVKEMRDRQREQQQAENEAALRAKAALASGALGGPVQPFKAQITPEGTKP